MNDQRLYVVFAHSDGSYVDVTVPDFPGLSSAGETTEMALRALDECWRDVVCSLVEDGLPIPEPTPATSLMNGFTNDANDMRLLLRPLPA